MPHPIVVHECSESQWSPALELIASVFVGEGFVSEARNSRGCRREVIEPSATMFTAIEEANPDRVLGVIVLPDRGSPLNLLAHGDEAEVRMLAVHPDGRGRGVGGHLVEACIRRAVLPPLAARRMVLWTQPTMYAAQRLYQRMGFMRVPERDTLLAPGSEGARGEVTRERWAYSLELLATRDRAFGQG